MQMFINQCQINTDTVYSSFTKAHPCNATDHGVNKKRRTSVFATIKITPNHQTLNVSIHYEIRAYK